jgi:hypothetical protein
VTAAIFAVALLLWPISTAVWADPVKELWNTRHKLNYGYFNPTVVVDGAGNVIVAGSTYNSTRNRAHGYIAKYAAGDGRRLWEQRPAFGYFGGFSVAVDSVGNVIVSESYGTDVDYQHHRYVIAKYTAADGRLAWERHYLDPVGAAPKIGVDEADNLIVVGRYSLELRAFAVEKYAAADGTLLWASRLPYGDEAFMALDEAGNVAVAGSSSGYYGFHYDSFTAKFAGEDGALLWLRRDDSGTKIPSSISADRVGNVATTGYIEDSYCYVTEDDDSNCYPYPRAIHSAKYSADGTLLWENEHNEGANDEAEGKIVAMDSAGDVVIFGSTRSGGYLAKYAAGDGAIVWEKRSQSNAVYSVIALDGADNILLGSCRNTKGLFDMHKTKKLAADGPLLWRTDFDDSAPRYMPISSMAVGPGFVVIAGSSYDGGSDIAAEDFTVKYVDGTTPQTLAADGLSPTEATLRGALNPNGFAADGAFEYGTDALLAAPMTTVSVAIGQGTAAVPLSARLFPLVPATVYYYRAVGYANGNITRGKIVSFTTAPSSRHLPPVSSKFSSPARPTPRPVYVR